MDQNSAAIPPVFLHLVRAKIEIPANQGIRRIVDPNVDKLHIGQGKVGKLDGAVDDTGDPAFANVVPTRPGGSTEVEELVDFVHL